MRDCRVKIGVMRQLHVISRAVMVHENLQAIAAFYTCPYNLVIRQPK